jgi:hypothetical protein
VKVDHRVKPDDDGTVDPTVMAVLDTAIHGGASIRGREWITGSSPVMTEGSSPVITEGSSPVMTEGSSPVMTKGRQAGDGERGGEGAG